MAPSKGLVAALLLCLMLSGCGGQEAKSEPAQTAEPEPEYIYVPAPEQSGAQGPALEYEKTPVMLGAAMLEDAYIKDGVKLLPLHTLCARLDFDLDFEEDMGTLRGRVEGTDFVSPPGENYMQAGGRYIFLEGGYVLRDGGLWLEAGAAAKLLGLELRDEPSGIYLDGTNAAPIMDGADYYELNFDMELLYWLPQIIHAEAYQQPMEGLIGVGNVVMNRVASEKFPDNIVDVIFSVDGVVQFEPVENGSIKAQPDERAYVAAYLCLEGCNTVGDSLFFVNPAYGSYWFDTELELTYVIGDHNFYRYK